MKTTIKLIFFLITLNSFSQQTANRIKFNYDSAGNQTKRYVCVNCLAKVSNNQDDNVDEKFSEDIGYDVKCFPNPVTEDLHLNWKSDSNFMINTIEVFSMSGQVLKSYTDISSTDSIIINFQEFTSGIYTVKLSFTNGNNKALKILKK